MSREESATRSSATPNMSANFQSFQAGMPQNPRGQSIFASTAFGGGNVPGNGQELLSFDPSRLRMNLTHAPARTPFQNMPPINSLPVPSAHHNRHHEQQQQHVAVDASSAAQHHQNQIPMQRNNSTVVGNGNANSARTQQDTVSNMCASNSLAMAASSPACNEQPSSSRITNLPPISASSSSISTSAFLDTHVPASEIIIELRTHSEVPPTSQLQTMELFGWFIPVGYLFCAIVIAVCAELFSISVASHACLGICPLASFIFVAHAFSIQSTFMIFGMIVFAMLMPQMCFEWSIFSYSCFCIGVSLCAAAGTRVRIAQFAWATFLITAASIGVAFSPGLSGQKEWSLRVSFVGMTLTLVLSSVPNALNVYKIRRYVFR